MMGDCYRIDFARLLDLKEPNQFHFENPSVKYNKFDKSQELVQDQQGLIRSLISS